MCFSAEADLVTGVVVTAVGIDAVRHVRNPRQLPLALLPLAFGVHQLIEVFVWRSLQGEASAGLGEAATWLYLLVAFVLPLWVPLAVRSVEPEPRRRRVMTVLAGAGLAVSLLLVGAIVVGPVGAAVGGRHIAYQVDVVGGVLVGVLYVVATCGALLVSSDRWIRAFGAVNLVAVVVLAWQVAGGFASLWCVWAAITSVVIDLYLRDAAGQHEVQPA